MPQYVYYVALSLKEYEALQKSQQVQVGNVYKHLEEKRSNQKKREFSINTGLALASLVGVGLGSKTIAESNSKFEQAIEGMKAAFYDNPPNTFYTNQDTLISIPEKVVAITEVEVFDKGKKVPHRSWTDELAPSEKMEEITKDSLSSDSSDYPIFCWVVSPIPPEVVHKLETLPMGLVTRHQSDAENLAKTGFTWSQTLLEKYIPQTNRDLIQSIPVELMYLMDPQIFDPENKISSHDKLNEQFKNLQTLWKNLLVDAKSHEEKHQILPKEMANALLGIIPLVSTRFGASSQDALSKAYEEFIQASKQYRQTMSEAIESIYPNDTKMQELHKLLDLCIYQEGIRHRLESIDDANLKIITPNVILSNFSDIKLQESKDEIMIFLTAAYNTNDPNAYRATIIDFLNKTKLPPDKYLEISSKINKTIDRTLASVFPFNQLSNEELLSIPPALVTTRFSSNFALELINAWKDIKQNPDAYRKVLFDICKEQINKAKSISEMEKLPSALLYGAYVPVIKDRIAHASGMTLTALAPEHIFQNIDIKIDLKELNKRFNDVSPKQEELYRTELLRIVNQLTNNLSPNETVQILQQLYRNVSVAYRAEQLVVTYPAIDLAKSIIEGYDPNKTEQKTASQLRSNPKKTEESQSMETAESKSSTRRKESQLPKQSMESERKTSVKPPEYTVRQFDKEPLIFEDYSPTLFSHSNTHLNSSKEEEKSQEEKQSTKTQPASTTQTRNIK